MALSPDTCCDTSVPQPIGQVEVISREIDVDNALDLTIANVGGAGGTTTVTAQVEDSAGDAVSGNFLVKFWFVDANDKGAAKSALPPSSPGWSEIELPTNGNGLITFEISNSESLAEWYLCASLFNLIYIAGPINLGV